MEEEKVVKKVNKVEKKSTDEKKKTSPRTTTSNKSSDTAKTSTAKKSTTKKSSEDVKDSTTKKTSTKIKAVEKSADAKTKATTKASSKKETVSPKKSNTEKDVTTKNSIKKSGTIKTEGKKTSTKTAKENVEKNDTTVSKKTAKDKSVEKTVKENYSDKKNVDNIEEGLISENKNDIVFDETKINNEYISLGDGFKFEDGILEIPNFEIDNVFDEKSLKDVQSNSDIKDILASLDDMKIGKDELEAIKSFDSLELYDDINDGKTIVFNGDTFNNKNKGSKNISIILCLSILGLLIFVIYSMFFNFVSYDVTFNTDGGTDVFLQNISDNSYIEKPIDPLKEGYIFEGWYYNNQIFNFNDKVTSDMVLVAKWTKIEVAAENYIVSFNSSLYGSVEVIENGLLTRPINPSLEGFDFECWSVDGVCYDFSKGVTSNLVLEPKFTVITQLTVEYYVNDVIYTTVLVNKGMVAENIIIDDINFLYWELNLSEYKFGGVYENLKLVAKFNELD